jgi:hypothetical protein
VHQHVGDEPQGAVRLPADQAVGDGHGAMREYGREWLGAAETCDEAAAGFLKAAAR